MRVLYKYINRDKLNHRLRFFQATFLVNQNKTFPQGTPLLYSITNNFLLQEKMWKEI